MPDDRSQSETYRQKQASLMRRVRQQAREISIPPIANQRRRRRCERNTELWLQTYMPAAFTHPFTRNQSRAIERAEYVMEYGGSQGLAMPRGYGKTTILSGVTLKAILTGVLRFPVCVGKNHEKAMELRGNIVSSVERSPTLIDDYPEVCYPVLSLENVPQRARTMTLENGHPLNFIWAGGNLMRFPNVPGSKASGAMIYVVGIDGAIRGANVEFMRPDFAFLDDIETEQSVKSNADIKKRRDTIDNAIGGLAAAGRSLARYYLCTIQTPDCLAAEYTDMQQRPEWNGIRCKALDQEPSDTERWATYMQMRREDKMSGDTEARRAHRYYLQNRTAMDRGAHIDNPYAYDDRQLPDGTSKEASALQGYYNLLADKGPEYVARELQNDPPNVDMAQSPEVSLPVILRHIGGPPRGVLPANPHCLTAAIDVHGKFLAWAVFAWRPGPVGNLLDYGYEPVYSPTEGHLSDPDNVTQTDKAIMDALHSLRGKLAGGYPDDEGTCRDVDVVLVDSGWKPRTVGSFCQAAGRQYWPSKGFGTGSRSGAYREPRQATKNLMIGDGWFARLDPHTNQALYHIDSDRWKRFVHDAFLAPPSTGAPNPGAIQLFGERHLPLQRYAEEILGQQWREEFVTGRGWKRYWDKVSHRDHYLDVTGYAAAAAAIMNLSMTPGHVQPSQRRVTLAEYMESQ